MRDVGHEVAAIDPVLPGVDGELRQLHNAAAHLRADLRKS